MIVAVPLLTFAVPPVTTTFDEVTVAGTDKVILPRVWLAKNGELQITPRTPADVARRARIGYKPDFDSLPLEINEGLRCPAAMRPKVHFAAKGWRRSPRTSERHGISLPPGLKNRAPPQQTIMSPRSPQVPARCTRRTTSRRPARRLGGISIRSGRETPPMTPTPSKTTDAPLPRGELCC